MFEATKWKFIDEHVAGTCKFEQVTPIVKHKDGEIAIAKQYTFSSQMLRMSVITKELNNDHMRVYTKGAPEKIVELCKPETVPHNFVDILKIYTANGYRVIGMAGKALDSSISWSNAMKLTRDSVESNLDFYGLMIMQNMMKPETTPIIHELIESGLRTVMVTGDNLLTALCIARKCGMVPQGNRVVLVEAFQSTTTNQLNNQESTGNSNDWTIVNEPVPARIEWKLTENLGDLDDPSVALNNQSNNMSSYQNQNTNIQTVLNLVNSTDSNFSFAMDGKTFGVLRKSFPKIFEKVLLNGVVYARMSPDQKAQLVESLISIGYCVSMCGDGANDCAALKAAHVGISLSEAEASVASPFTSKIQNISCVPEVIKEGRAALVTSFGVFKYMALYSMIQFVSVLILYAVNLKCYFLHNLNIKNLFFFSYKSQ